MRLNYFLLFSCVLLFSSCEIKVNNPGSSSETAGSKGKIRNKIELHEKNIKVLQAYLQYDSGKLVPDDNK